MDVYLSLCQNKGICTRFTLMESFALFYKTSFDSQYVRSILFV